MSDRVPAPHSSLGRIGTLAPLQTTKSVDLSVQFIQEQEPTACLEVWACVVPFKAISLAVLSRSNDHDDFQFTILPYNLFLSPRASVLGKLSLKHRDSPGVLADVRDPHA